MKFKPSKSQQTVLDCKDKNILVSASAGTGKTTVMIEKISGLLTEGRATLKELLVVTFTEMAAYEMKKRLVKNLSQSDDKKILSQLGQIDTCDISTLHSFCSALIRKYFVEAEIDPAYKIISESEWAIAYDKVLDQVFEDLYRENDADFLSLVEVFGKNRRDESLKRVVKSLYSFKVSKHNFNGWLEKHKQQYQIDQNGQNFFTIQFNNDVCDDFEQIKQTCEQLAVQSKQLGINKLVSYFAGIACDIYVSRNKTLAQNFDEIANFSMPTWPTRAIEKEVETEAQQNFVVQAKMAKDLLNKKGKTHSEFIKQFSCFGDLVGGMENSCALCIKAFDLVQKFQTAFDNYKQQNGCLDFNDLEHKAIKVLGVQKVRSEIQQKYKFVFADEYQDINEIQEEIISLVKGDDNLFLVGDVKQSIYAFRQCAPDIFVEKLGSCQNDEKHLVAYLNENYRSHSHVLDFVNFVFARLMTKRFGGVDYQNTSMLDSPAQSNAGKTSLEAININVIVTGAKEEKESESECETTEIYSVKKHNYADLDSQKAEANVIAKKIREVVGLKIKVEGQEKIITYNDIVLLARNMGASTKKIVAQLQSLGLPVVYSSKQNLFDSTEIKQLVNMFRLADNPYDDVSAFACLTGFFCGITDDDVAEVFVQTKQKQQDLQKMPKSVVERVADYCHSHDNTLSATLHAFLQFLNKITFLSKHLSVTQLASKLFAETDYVLKVLGLPDGEVRLKKVNDFLISLESKSYNKNVSEFLHFISSVSNEQVEVESASQINAIRVMTIHKSKGLEFPVVFVINCGQKFNLTSDAIICDKKHGFATDSFEAESRIKIDTLSSHIIRSKARHAMCEEEMRVLYVAMTRAKSHLFLTGCAKKVCDEKSDEKGMSYFDWIFASVANSDYHKNNCSFYSDWIADGQDKKESRKLPEIKQADSNRTEQIKMQLLQKYPYQFATTLELKAVSSKLHDYQKPQDDEDVYVSKVVANDVDADGLQQSEIGTGYHAVFEHLDFKNKTVEHIASVLKMLVEKGIVTNQVAQAVDKNVVLKAMNSPLFDQLDGKKIYRELPFMLKTSYQNLFGGDVDEDMFLQGVIDLLAVGDGEAVVVDYKYTKRPQYIKQNYQKQLDSYAQAVKQILKIDNVKKYVLSLADGQIVEL